MEAGYSRSETDRTPQLACIVKDEGEILGYLAIDSFVGGRSHGGLRMRQDVTLEEISMLARTMTLKYGFLGLPFGGAKAGVICDPEAPLDERRLAMVRFGRALAPLLRKELFVPAADMGTQLEDIRHMLQEAGVHYHKRRLPPVSSGTYTAHSVFAVVRELARAQDRSLADLRVAVEGFGKVGSVLACLLAEAGARVVAVSTLHGALYARDGLDVAALLAAYDRTGSARLPEINGAQSIQSCDVPALAVDALCPCAGIHSIHAENALDVKARILCPGANNPWTEEAASVLEANGALLLPEFAVNTGGILGALMVYARFSHDEILETIHWHFASTTRSLLQVAKERGLPPRIIAEELVADRLVGKAAESRQNLQRMALDVGLALHRRGLVPGVLVRLFARPYLRSKLKLGLPL